MVTPDVKIVRHSSKRGHAQPELRPAAAGSSGGFHRRYPLGFSVAFQPLLVGPHLCCAPIAEVAVLLQRLLDNAFQLEDDRRFPSLPCEETRSVEIGQVDRFGSTLLGDCFHKGGRYFSIKCIFRGVDGERKSKGCSEQQRVERAKQKKRRGKCTRHIGVRM